jgi:hypothetical protein
MIGVVRNIAERPVDFCYGFNMTCESCGDVTPLTADRYHRDREDARMKCEHCGEEIWYGPNVMALRDADDPVLDDDAAFSVAWYHTSVVPDWPPDGRPMTAQEAGFTARYVGLDGIDAVREWQENQALHLGTYEAAIECMLRKMRYENLGGAQFWLYRVALRREGTRIRPGFLNETFDEISQVTQDELGEWGAVRYLNTWESPGSISLAVRPQSLATVQGIELPAFPRSAGAAPSLLRDVTRIRDRISQIEATRDDGPDPTERLRQRRAAAEGETLPREPTPEQQDLQTRIDDLIAEEHLPGVSVLVREKFSGAMQAWSEAQETEPDDLALITRFSAMAAALTGPGSIQANLDAAVLRTL